MTLVFDLRTMQVLFHPSEDGRHREVRTMTIAEAIDLIEKERRRRTPKWRQYYLKHHEGELARQRAYRASHREQVREYNQQYYQSRKKQKAAPPGPVVITQEVVACST